MNKPKIPKISFTTNYGMFKRINSNREINKNHLRKLKAGIQAKNLLYLFPIVVNKDMEIVDGQHRLKASEELRLPIYYIIDNSITKADIAMVNSNRKGWSAKDYISFYAEEGKKPYKHLQELLEYPITIMTGIKLLDKTSTSYYDGGSMTQKMRAGNINSENYNLAILICDLCAKLNKDGLQYATTAPFMMDVKNAILKSELPHKQCVNKIQEMKHVFPEILEIGETCLKILRNLLEPATKEKRGMLSMDELEEIAKAQKKENRIISEIKTVK